MATMVARGPNLDLSATSGPALLSDKHLHRYTGDGVSLNGQVRSSSVAGDEDLGWLEPPAGVDPGARFIATLRLRTDAGAAVGIVVPVEVYDLPEGQLVRAVHYTLTVAVGTTRDQHAIRWWLEPGGDDAALRADSLRFLRALHEPGTLMLDFPDETVARLRVPGGPFDPDLEQARAVVEDVALLEEWTGTKIPLPVFVGPADVQDIVRAAAIVRARSVPLQLGDSLVLTVDLPDDPDVHAIDAVTFPREVTVTVLGAGLALGEADLELRVDVVEATPGPQGWKVECRLKPDEPRSVFAHLFPPASRSRVVRRTLVGGAPLPHDGLLSRDVARDFRRRALSAFLDGAQAEGAPAPQDRAEVEAQWPE